jgi:hypothetical protein
MKWNRQESCRGRHDWAAMVALALIAGCAQERLTVRPVPMWNDEIVNVLAASGGYVHQEASAFIEFCVELDSQDDRNEHPESDVFRPRIDAQLWQLAYDSRAAVAADYLQFKARPSSPVSAGSVADDDLSHWAKLYDLIERTAAKRKINIQNVAGIANNPDLNGFGPWQNAWILYKGVGPNSGRYAIAIRGTVFSNSPSAIEDALFQPVIGRDFLSNDVSFTHSGNATIHSGFLHATFTLLFDRRYGILQILKDHHVESTSTLYIIGHSQGAAMATLVHAFLFNALSVAESSPDDPLGLKGERYRLKSYAFAQPKPGNYPFAAEFARYTQGPDTAIVINNDIDPVPKVPMTMQSTADLETDFHGRFLVANVVRSLGGISKALRSTISGVCEPFTRRSAMGYGYYYNWSQLHVNVQNDRTGWSWDFVPAGRVIIVFGTPIADPGSDIFFQHHATTYRDLLAAQLATH